MEFEEGVGVAIQICMEQVLTMKTFRISHIY